MTTKWKIRRTQWSWSLFYDGDLVCSADRPYDLIEYTLMIKETVNPSYN